MRLRVGGVECAVVDDSPLLLSPDVVFPAARRSEWPDIHLDEQGLYACPLQCLVVRPQGQLILLDAGNGTLPGKRWTGGGHLVQSLDELGIRPADVDVVIVSHLHSDHVGGVVSQIDGVFRPTFPRARHLLPRADWDYFLAPDRAAQRPLLRDSLAAVSDCGQVDLVEGDERVTSDVRLLSTPGHTPGHVVTAIESEGQTALFVGDLVHHHVELERPDFVRDDEALLELVPDARRRVVDLAVSTDALVVIPHEAFPGVGRLRRRDGRVSWEPAA